MRAAGALALVLTLGSSGCAHQLTNEQLAVGAVAVAAIVAVSIVSSGPWYHCATSFSCPTPSWTSDDSMAPWVPPVLSTRPHPIAGR